MPFGVGCQRHYVTYVWKTSHNNMKA